MFTGWSSAIGCSDVLKCWCLLLLSQSDLLSVEEDTTSQSACSGSVHLELLMGAVDDFLLVVFGQFSSCAYHHCSNPQSSFCQGCSDIVSHCCCQTACCMQLCVYLLAVKVQGCVFCQHKEPALVKLCLPLNASARSSLNPRAKCLDISLHFWKTVQNKT